MRYSDPVTRLSWLIQHCVRSLDGGEREKKPAKFIWRVKAYPGESLNLIPTLNLVGVGVSRSLKKSGSQTVKRHNYFLKRFLV